MHTQLYCKRYTKASRPWRFINIGLNWNQVWTPLIYIFSDTLLFFLFFYEWFDDFVSTEDNLYTVKLQVAIPLLGDYLIIKDYSPKKISQTLLLECTWMHFPLRASLSGTFLQTLPDLVTPLKGHSLSPRSYPPTRSAPSERFGYWKDCGSNLAPKHTRKNGTHPPRV